MTTNALQYATDWVTARLDAADLAALMAPISIGRVRLENRFVMSAMGTRSATLDGFVTDEQVAYYRRRGTGGTAAIVVEGSSVDATGTTYPRKPRLYHDRYARGLARLASAVRAGGAVPGIQLMHAGRHASPRVRTGPALSPSGGGSPFHREQSRQMTISEIEAIVESFAKAAQRAQRAGFELIEIHGAHGYLIHDFLSPITNVRSDRWGGTQENRAEFLRAVVSAVTSAVEGNCGVIVRLSSSEFRPDGLTIEDAIAYAGRAVSAGADAVLVSGGNGEAQEWVVPPVFLPPGLYIDSAERVRQAVGVPVGVVGRISTPQIAASAIRRGAADLVFLARALLADPDFVKKLSNGARPPIRPCIACNECLAQHIRDESICCTVNPEAGREYLPAPSGASTRRRIAVIGGGPAGMLFASAATSRGHAVTLIERSGVLGGKLWLAAAAPYKTTEMLALQVSLELELRQKGVALRLGTHGSLTDVLDEIAPDVVVVATGAMPLPYAEPTAGVTEAEDYLSAGQDPPWRAVAILGAGDTACDAATRLAGVGVAVTMLARGDRIARGLEPLSSKLLRRRLRELDVHVLFNTRVTAIRNGVIEFFDAEGNLSSLEVDHVLHARGVEPSGAAVSLEIETTAEVITIGDAEVPGNFLTSMRSAWELARRI